MRDEDERRKDAERYENDGAHGGAAQRGQAGMARWRAAVPLLVALLTSILLFLLVGRGSSFLAVDSGPYLSIAHNLLTSGRPVCSLGFVGSATHLPGVPSFIPPGFALLIALARPLAGDLLGAAVVVLFLSLFGLHLAVIYYLERSTGHRGYAVAASLVLVAAAPVAGWAGTALSDLPFLACCATATLAGLAVLQGVPSRTLRWLALPFAAAAVCTVRYLGVFFPLAFTAAGLALRRRGGRSPGLGYLAFVNAAAFLPLAIWLLAARGANSSWLPRRPPSQLDLAQALLEAGALLAGWLGPWVVVGLLLWPTLRRAAPRHAAKARSPAADPAVLLPACGLVFYVGLLIAVRTRHALYPLTTLGERYMAPAWLFAFLLAAPLFFRWVWQRRGRLATFAAPLLALALISLALRGLARQETPPPFPTAGRTFAAAVALVEPGAAVLANFGQPLIAARPDLRVLTIPSRQDFRYDMDLPALVAQHELGWIALFTTRTNAELYPPWLETWLYSPPPGVDIVRTWRLEDGVLYRLAPP